MTCLARSVFVSLLVALVSAGCGGDPAPAGRGDACGPSRGCDEGLTCSGGVCVAIASGPTDGGGNVSDAGVLEDGGTTTDAGEDDGGAGDAGSGDGGTTGSDGGADGGSCGPCNTPPTPCHAVTGTCTMGVCEYAFVENAPCDDGNACTVGDTCSAGGCTGSPMVCETPPGNVCISGSQLKTWDQNGSCQGGLCTYASQTVTCSGGGCSNGACQTDPCANVTCNTPPNGCFTSAGVCQNGSCSYPFNNGAACSDGNSCTDNDACNSGVCQGAPKACNSPPANVCENATTLRAYASTGSCNVGQCSYSYAFVSCANGCANAQCAGSGWTVMNSNVTVDLNAVWAASPSSVWAGGDLGTLVFFNGVQWQVRSSGTGSDIEEIDGTSASNVFALAGLSQLLHFDGTAWSVIQASIPLYNSYSISAIGPKDVLVFGRVSSSSSTEALIRVTQVSGAWQVSTVKSGGFRSPNYGFKMQATSLNDVYVPGGNHWDGSTITQLGQATYFSRGPGRLFKSGSLLLGLDWQNGNTPLYRYDASASLWTPMATGFSGTLSDLDGVSASRVFLSGWTYANSTYTGHVLYFDGVGWVDLVLPAGVGRLNGIESLVSGEVFAVGRAGLIIRGP